MPTVCGEEQRLAIAAQQPRFVASQGVSLFTVENTPGGLLSNFVRAVAFDTTGLWIGYHATEAAQTSGGLSHFDKTTWANCNSASGLGDKNVNAIAHDARGRLWLTAEQTGGVMMFDGTAWHSYTTADGLPSNDTFRITVDEEDNIWIATYQGVAKYNGHRWTVPYSQANQTIFSNHVHDIAFDHDGGIWIGHHDAGISYLAVNSRDWQHITAEEGLGGDHVRHILATAATSDGGNSVWVALLGGGLSHFDGQQWNSYTTADGLPSNDVYHVAEDTYQRIWAATGAGVVYREGDTWQIYHSFPALHIAFSSIGCEACPYDGDHVVTGTFAHGFTHSRLPYPTLAVDILQACFFLNEDRSEQGIKPTADFCTRPYKLADTHYRVEYPAQLPADSQLRLEITARPLAPYQLREDRGDFLSNLVDTEEERFGAYELMPVKGTIESGQPFTFTSYDDPLSLPTVKATEPFTITSSWRVWMHTRYAGPVLDIAIPVLPHAESQ